MIDNSSMKDLFALGFTDELLDYFRVIGPYQTVDQYVRVLNATLEYPEGDMYLTTAATFSDLEIQKTDEHHHLGKLFHQRGRAAAKDILAMLAEDHNFAQSIRSSRSYRLATFLRFRLDKLRFWLNTMWVATTNLFRRHR